MVIPKVLAQNSGLDPQDSIVKLQEEFVRSGQPVGLDLSTGALFNVLCRYVIMCVSLGEAMIPSEEGIWDNFRVKKMLLYNW